MRELDKQAKQTLITKIPKRGNACVHKHCVLYRKLAFKGQSQTHMNMVVQVLFEGRIAGHFLSWFTSCFAQFEWINQTLTETVINFISFISLVTPHSVYDLVSLSVVCFNSNGSFLSVVHVQYAFGRCVYEKWLYCTVYCFCVPWEPHSWPWCCQLSCRNWIYMFFTCFCVFLCFIYGIQYFSTSLKECRMTLTWMNSMNFKTDWALKPLKNRIQHGHFITF